MLGFTSGECVLKTILCCSCNLQPSKLDKSIEKMRTKVRQSCLPIPGVRIIVAGDLPYTW